MELNGYIDEDRLDELFLDKKISCADYVKHHSPDMLQAYRAFLRDNELQDTEASASKFLDSENMSMAQEYEENELQDVDAGKDESVAVYDDWMQDKKRLDALVMDNEVAAKVTLWRYQNPGSSEMQLCASHVGEEMDEVEKWWQTIDFINGSLGGGHFRLIEVSLDNVKTVISDAVLQATMS